jgi:hypothetical protein
MIHPVTGENISSYKPLMNNSATAEIRMMAFGKDFGGMSQGNNKTSQKGTNAIMFVMLPSNTPNIPKDRVVTYARVVVNHCPQKADPNQIQITASGNLIHYPSKLTTWTANIMIAELLWNSVLSMPGAKYMTLDIKNLLPFCPTRPIRIHAHSFCPISPMDHQTICPEGQSPQRTHLFGNATCHVGPSTGWHLSQQAPQETPCPTRIF